VQYPCCEAAPARVAAAAAAVQSSVPMGCTQSIRDLKGFTRVTTAATHVPAIVLKLGCRMLSFVPSVPAAAPNSLLACSCTHASTNQHMPLSCMHVASMHAGLVLGTINEAGSSSSGAELRACTRTQSIRDLVGCRTSKGLHSCDRCRHALLASSCTHASTNQHIAPKLHACCKHACRPSSRYH
jgi:hypothetical protein